MDRFFAEASAAETPTRSGNASSSSAAQPASQLSSISNVQRWPTTLNDLKVSLAQNHPVTPDSAAQPVPDSTDVAPFGTEAARFSRAQNAPVAASSAVPPRGQT